MLSCSFGYHILLIISTPLFKVQGIIGGQPAESYFFFTVVMMSDQKCGGTLLTSDVVLTAAHCIYHHAQNRWPSPIDIYVLYGNFFTPNGWVLKYHSCKNYEVHKEYDPTKYRGTGPYDIGLVKLEQKIAMRYGGSKTYMKSCIPQQNRKYTPGTVVGLGLTNQNPNRHAVQLMEADMQVNTSCGKHDRSTGFIYPGIQICYSALDGESNMCKGDSGGPIVFKKDGRAVCTIGIASFIADKCDNTDYPTVFTEVGIFHNWIKRRLRHLRNEMES